MSSITQPNVHTMFSPKSFPETSIVDKAIWEQHIIYMLYIYCYSGELTMCKTQSRKAKLAIQKENLPEKE